jgi:transposase
MPIPYSNDLRKKVINLLEKEKKSQNQVAKMLDIGQSTISKWYIRHKEQGHCDFKGYNNNRDKIKVKDPDRIKELIKKSPFITAKEIARKLSLDVTDVTILNYIKRLGLSFKKTQGFIEKEMKE